MIRYKNFDSIPGNENKMELIYHVIMYIHTHLKILMHFYLYYINMESMLIKLQL